MIRALVVALCFALAAPAARAEDPVYAAPVAAPATSTQIVWKDPDGTLHVGAWRSSDAEVKLAQRLVLAETARDACHNALGDAQAKKALDCGEQAAKTGNLWIWVTGGVVAGAAAGFFAAKAIK